MSPSPRSSIGVALGGGSARGYAHIGALAALERHDLGPGVIAGTSFGAVIGALYAVGRTPEELTAQAALMRRRDVFPSVVDFGLHQAALFRGRRLEAYFDRLVEGRSFEDLDRTLVIIATDADTGERVEIRSGPLAPALRASASIPGVFAAAVVDGRRLIDGGIGSPVPLRTLDGFDLDLRVGIGAGVDATDSATIRLVRQALDHPLGRRLHDLLGRGGAGPVGDLARAAAWTLDGYLDDGAADALQVHTHPPISWLRFDRAADAIVAGEHALETAAPRLRAALLEAAGASGRVAGFATTGAAD